MNRAYRLVWSHTRRTWVVASETARCRGKNGGGRTLINTIATALVLAGGSPSLAIAGLVNTYTWSGGAGTSNWSDVANWNPNGFPSIFPSDMSTDPDWDKLIFGGAAGGTLNNDVGSYSTGLEFSSGAGAYTLTSTGFDISVVGISNLSSSMQTISMNVNKHKRIDATYDAGAAGLTINGNFNLSSYGPHSVTLTGSANTTITGNVNANRSTIIKTGTGTFTINGLLSTDDNNIVINQGALSLSSYSGSLRNTLTFNGGTLKATGTFTLSADTTINSGGGTIDTGSNTVTLSNNISGTGALTKTGSGTLVLSGTNNYSGGTTVSAGTLQGTTSGLQGNISNSGSVVFNQDTDGTYAGNVSGTGTLSKSGSGVVTLSGSNSYSGGTTVTGGTLRSGSASAFASNKAFTVNGGTLDLNGYALTMSSLSGSGSAVTLGSAALTVNQSSTSNYAGNITGTGSLTKQGSGTLTLSGTNTYSGGTTVSAGTLQSGSASAFANNKDFTVNGGTLDLNSNDLTMRSLSGSGGSVVLGSAALTAYQNSNTTYTGNISGTGSLTKTGVGTLTLSGSNTYSGGTTVADGTLRSGSASAFASNTAYTVNGGTLNLNNNDLTMSSLSGSGGRILIGNAALTVNQSTNTTYTGDMIGTGTLTKQGNGTLTLSGTNTYSGGTTVSAGTLQSGSANAFIANSAYTVNGGTLDLNGHALTMSSLSGSGGAVTLGSAALTLNQSGNTSYAGNISGAGSLIKQGTGTLTLSGANTYTGTTTVNAGTLSLADSSAIADTGAVVVNDGGTLNLAASETIGSLAGAGNVTLNTSTLTTGGNNASTIYSGAMTGSGMLTKTGTGTFTLTGNSEFSAPTFVKGGTLDISSGGTLRNLFGRVGDAADEVGTVVVDGIGSAWTNTDALVVGHNGTGTLNIADGGTVNVGSGPLSLAAAASASGTLNIGTGVEAGVLNATAVDGGLGTATLNFNHIGGDYYFTDDGTATGTAINITGSTAVNHIGSGTTYLTGTNTYSGATTVSGGTLAVNGSLTNSAVTVASGGTLGGSGSIAGAVTVNSGGTLAPGNSPGLLSVGSLTLDAGSTTMMEIDGTERGTQYDAIDVTGTATLGGTLNLVFGYTPTVGDSYTLIDAAAINGDFSSIATTGLGAALKVVPTITDNYVMTVNFAQESFVTAAGGTGALTGNQSSVATNLDTFSTSGQATDLIAALNTLPAGALPSAYDQISGASHTFAPTLAGNAVRQFSHVLGQRSGGIQAGDGASTAFNALTGVKLAYAGDNLASLVAGEKVDRDGFWVRALAADGRINSDGNAAGADTSGTGLALGADRWIDANRLAGVALAYGTSRADSGSGKLDVESFQLAAYGRWQDEAYYLDGSLGYGRHRTESRRDIAFLNQQARADYDTDSLSLNLEMGRPIARGPATLTPYAGIEGTMLRREGFTETGSAANLSVAGDTQTGWRSRLGARYQWSGTRFQPTLDLAWVHAFGDAATQVDARFAAAPTASAFRVAGPELDRDRLALGLGLTAWTGKHARLDLNYNGEFASSDRDQHVAATFRWVW